MDKFNNKKKHFTASALIVENDKVLLVYHRKLKVWLHPGGHVEDWENPDETLIREVKEETGLTVSIVSNKDKTLSNKQADVVSLNIPYVVLCELVGNHYHNDLIYLCEIDHSKKEEMKFDTSESGGIKFFSVKELEEIKLFDNFRVLLNKVLKER
jgi:8-oxo-dGTP pyrophosphatase MutT (NUDIX family)